MKTKVLLLSAYRSDSHASWADWLQQYLDVDWRVLELPGRYFRWRIRGNPLSWLEALPELLNGWQPDRILATSMVDISTIRGLFPQLAGVPLDYYFHENQFAYPLGAGQHSSLDPQMVQLYGALAADRLWFNSEFNQTSFLDGVGQLLKKLPDHKPTNLRARLQQKCGWLPVPLTAIGSGGDKMPGLIVWNHRWEYDKCPEVFLAVLQSLQQRQLDFKLALLGPRAKQIPPALQQIECQFAEHIVVNGRVSRADYVYWLQRAEVVISTAKHEFQGLSMLEACSAGAIPVVPDDLCYREQYPPEHRFPVADAERAADIVQAAFTGQLSSVDVQAWLAESTAARWHTLFVV
ncbi:tRNA-queuosine alpha-mannosyltransferase domain-containing protein [Bacterioplanoides pacificum]|uniref:tRNA-queuosine alpha-mannosyltransferase n=1 Tax=Bacterioplanoides pacificum TaxID=1171596 RepID=A0ABV7VQX1_9GAMM